jgi:hypothetical protein
MGPVHWLDALTPPLEQHLQRLVHSVGALVRAGATPASVEGETLLRAGEAVTGVDEKPSAQLDHEGELERQRPEEERRQLEEARRRAAEEAERRRLEEEAARREEARRREEEQARQRAAEEAERQRQEKQAQLAAAAARQATVAESPSAPEAAIVARLAGDEGGQERFAAAPADTGDAATVTSSATPELAPKRRRLWPSRTAARVALVIVLVLLCPVLAMLAYSGFLQYRDWLGSPNRTISGDLANISSGGFSPDGARLATSSLGYFTDCPDYGRIDTCKKHVTPDYGVHVWNPTTGAVPLSLPTVPAESDQAIFSSDGKWIIATGRDRTVKIWDAVTGLLLRTIPQPTWPARVSLSADGQFVATDNGNIWSATTGKLVRKLAEDCTYAAGFSPDGKRVVTDSQYPHWQMMVCDAQSGQVLFGLKDSNNTKHSTFFPDGKRILAGGWGISIWNAATGELINRFGDGRIDSVSLSADGKWIASAWFNHVEIWDANSYALVRSLYSPRSYPGLALSADGKRLAGFKNNFIDIWDLP